jgi:hypothetical protein
MSGLAVAQDTYGQEPKPGSEQTGQQTEPMPAGEEQQTGMPAQPQTGTEQQQPGMEQQAGMEKEPMQGEHKELTGKVLGVHEKNLIIEGTNGEAIPLKVNHETKVSGVQLKKDQRIDSHLKKEFKEGDEVRASFELKRERGGVENLALTLDSNK